MPSVSCACGRSVEGPPGDSACPGCGAVLTIPADKIRFRCACGAPLAASPSFAGKLIKCPRCAEPVAVPRAEPELDLKPLPPEPPSAVPAPAPPRLQPRPRSAPPAESASSRWTRYALAAAVLPLLFLMLFEEEGAEERLGRMIEEHPEIAERLKNVGGDDAEAFFQVLPDQRIEGALHDRFTWIHWFYALASAVAFWAFIRFCWPMGTATSGQLWFLGILTGTVGILLLLGFQWVALHLNGRAFVPRGIVGILFLVVKFIGYSYRAALDPENGFFPSMMGFTLGVGLCEELCKTLPLLLMVRGAKTLDARGLALLGLATGVGFGVSEGIHYSSDMYNGISGGTIYVVRFISCVALHAVWSAASALVLWGAQAEIDGIDAWYDWFIPVLKVLGISMVLHGAYDTFLKRELEILALLTAVASFVWFFWLYERTLAAERSVSPA